MKYQKISYMDTANGSGIGIVLWCSGCPHRCKGCHNPHTWNRYQGQDFTSDDLGKLLEDLSKPYVRRFTFSGGDPLAEYNRVDTFRIAKSIKSILPEKKIWLYTGYLWEEINQLPIISYTDVLVDGKFEIDKKDISLPWCGSTNQRVIDVKATIQNNKIIVFSK